MPRYELPYAFKQLTGSFYSGLMEEYSDPVAFLDDTVKRKTHAHLIEARDFVAKVLSDGSTDADLSHVWDSGYSDCLIYADGSRAFFQAILDALERRLAQIEADAG